jgi:hypothetical protein
LPSALSDVIVRGGLNANSPEAASTGTLPTLTEKCAGRKTKNDKLVEGTVLKMAEASKFISVT